VKRTVRLLFAIALIALAATPAAAAPTRVDALPEITAAQSNRFDFALTLFGQVIGYGKGEVESPNRIHLAVETVPQGNEPVETVEAIIYDGVFYVRENQNTQWYIEGEVPAPLPEDELPVTDVAAGDVAITLIGDADVAGAPTSQYQLWINGEDGSVITSDLFIGRGGPSYLHKLVVSGYSSGEDTVPLLTLDYRYYDFNAQITVYRPEGAVARPASAARSLAGLLKQSIFQAREAAHFSR